MHLEDSQSHALLVQVQGARGHGRLSDFDEISIRVADVAPQFRCINFGFSDEFRAPRRSQAVVAPDVGHAKIYVNVWTFVSGKKKETLTFHPHLSMNDYAGLAAALLAGTGIGDLPPLVQPELLRDGRLVEVLPNWHFCNFHLWLVHLGNRYITRPVRVFKEFAAQMAPTLFPSLPA